MEKLKYKISSRATILLGRESVSKVEGAIIELIKNSYDADADLCYVYFDIANNSLYLIDNGMGMTKKIIEDYWMTIGTDNKKTEYISPKGRVKSGEKGIGRFALDRLGSICELYSKNKSEQIIRWKTNWDSFEESGKMLEDIEAEFEFLDSKLNSYLPEAIIENIEKLKSDNNIKFDFESGTIIRIIDLRDNWTENKISNLKKSLEFLIPPMEQDKFILCIQKDNFSKYELVENTFSEEYDYKIESKFDGENFNIRLFRKEFDLSKISDDIFREEAFNKFPYRKEDFYSNQLNFKYKISELLNNSDANIIQKVREIGRFQFQFIFMKLSIPKKEEFFYKEIGKNRKNWLEEHGGIKIYRDNFWVRPYGENKSNSFDWLGLEARNNANPVAVSSDTGRWTVRNAQGQGSVFISRIENVAILDKSSREGIIENSTFSLLKEILIKIISILEKDRAYIAKNFKFYYNKTNEKEIIKNKSIEIAKSINEDIILQNQDISTKESNLKDLAKAIQYFKEDKEELITELKLMRALATNGLITTSIVHDLKTINELLVSRVDGFRSAIENNNENLINRNIEDLLETDNFIKSWISVIINQVKIDKRKRLKKNICDTVNDIISAIKPILEKKQIQINSKGFNNKIEKKIFVSDFESIIYNLIINSIESFERESRNTREINISVKSNESEFFILYSDNGYGLGSNFKDPYEIFRYGISSKTNKDGDKIGTGLGMYIISSTVREYNGEIKLIEFSDKFSLSMKFPIRKGEF